MSEQHVRQAFNLNPNDAETMMQKGRLLAMRGKPEEAWVGSRLPSASIRCIRLGTTLISASRSIRFGVLTRAAQAFRRLPDAGTWFACAACSLLWPSRKERRGTGSSGGNPTPAARFLDGGLHAQERSSRTCGRPRASPRRPAQGWIAGIARPGPETTAPCPKQARFERKRLLPTSDRKGIIFLPVLVDVALHLLSHEAGGLDGALFPGEDARRHDASKPTSARLRRTRPNRPRPGRCRDAVCTRAFEPGGLTM